MDQALAAQLFSAPPEGFGDRGGQFVDAGRFEQIIDGIGFDGSDGALQRGMAGENNDAQIGVHLTGAPHDLDAAQVWHAHVQKHHVVRRALQHLEGLPPGGSDIGAVLQKGEGARERRAHRLLVVHDEHARPGNGRRGGCVRHANLSFRWARSAVGSITVNTTPRSSPRLCTRIVPPCCSTIR